MNYFFLEGIISKPIFQTHPIDSLCEQSENQSNTRSLKCKTWDGFISKVDSDVVVARFGWEVFYFTGAVPIVASVYLGLHRSFNTQAQASLASSLHVHSKHCPLVGVASLKTFMTLNIKHFVDFW